MSQEQSDQSKSYTIAPKQSGNPEGKGMNAFMLDWHRSAPRGVVAKPRRQLLAEFFTSMLVLSAKFKFRPVIGAKHYLYWFEGEWSLSLIAPDEWTAERRDAYAATCRLQEDMTWTIEPSESLTEDNPITDAVSSFYDAFADTLDTDQPLETILPFYVDKLPYYQRLYASALSRSITASLTSGHQLDMDSQSWRQLLSEHENPLLSSEPEKS